MQEDYEYDIFNNRTKKTVTQTDGTYVTEYGYTANNLLDFETFGESINNTTQTQSRINYTYDSRGNLNTKTILDSTNTVQSEIEYDFDYLNRLSNISSGNDVYSYLYNGDNLRKSKTINNNTTQYILDGMNVVAELNSQGNRTYLMGINLEGYLSGNNRRYYSTEPNGTVYSVYGDDTANYESIDNYIYGAYGNTLSAGQTDNPFKFAGEYTDSETGLIYLRNRYYDPATSRMLSEDPAKQGLNWYVYCNNNPLKYIDPSGLTYVIAWSYGKADLKPYTDSQGNVNWTKFTAENSFARAAATRKQELINMGVPASKIDVQRIDNESDMKSTWEMWAGYDIIEGMNIYSHGYSDGISVAGDGGEFLSNTTKLKWGSMLRLLKVNGKMSGVVTSPYAVFHGCNTANGDFAQNFANTQGVTTYAQTGFASFSKNPTWHIPIDDGAIDGSVYLYHFNWNNLKNTDGLGKVFYAQ